jgi:hypothetical protein
MRIQVGAKAASLKLVKGKLVSKRCPRRVFAPVSSIVPYRNRFPNTPLTEASKLIFPVKAGLKPPRVGSVSYPRRSGVKRIGP